ncbi:MAG: cation:proton antiporter [Thaumarchaeota archaeon]|nr:MAG: cation:proton antiporter [Nitrososphaerota archaeon]
MISGPSRGGAVRNLNASSPAIGEREKSLSEEESLADRTEFGVAVDSTTIFLLDLGIFSVFALIFSLAFARLRLPVVSAQIVAGMIAGPYVLGWVKDLVTINDLSAIGIVLLLFVIGLELDPVELRKLAGRVAGVAVLEMGVAFVLGFAASSVILGAGLLQSIIFAMVASISSTAIIGKMFLERGSRPLVNSPEPGALMALMIMEDMVAVVFLIALSSFTSNGTLLSGGSLVQVVTTIGGGIALVVAGYLVATYVAPKIIDYLGAFEEEYEEIPFLFALGLGFVFAVLAAVFGYSPGTGAFIIGLSIRGKRSKFLKSRITTIKDLFIVLFFISMGSLINPIPALIIGLPLLGVMALVVSGKLVGGFASAKIFLRMGSSKSAYLFGSWLVPRGEFSFVIGQLALTLGIIDSGFFSLIGLVVLVTAIVGPVIQRLAESRGAPAMFPTKAKTDPSEDR